jgi:hypothetical protein
VNCPDTELDSPSSRRKFKRLRPVGRAVLDNFTNLSYFDYIEFLGNNLYAGAPS